MDSYFILYIYVSFFSRLDEKQWSIRMGGVEIVLKIAVEQHFNREFRFERMRRHCNVGNGFTMTKKYF